MNININMAGQEEGKFRKLYLVIGVIGIIYIALSFIIPNLAPGNNYFLWIVFLPGFAEAILYGLGKKRIFADNFPYIRIDEEKIEKSKGGFFAKPDITYWNSVTHIDIKLFEIRLTTLEGRLKTVDLEALTDENLKLVKEFLLTVKKNRGL